MERFFTNRQQLSLMGSLTKEQIAYWSKKYDQEEDQYNTGLERELGDRLRRTRVLTKNDLIQIIEWKFQGRLLGRRKLFLKLLSSVTDDSVRKVSSESFNEQDERLRIRKLMRRYGGIAGVGPAVASVILTFYDPKNYGVFDIHAWRELFGKEPPDLFSNFDRLVAFLDRLREEAKQTGHEARIVEKAYFKKNLDESRLKGSEQPH